MKKSQFDELWKNIKITGFDAALKNAETERTKLKGAWENETGENYGSQKAASWKPDNIYENHEKLAELRKEKEIAIGTIAINDNDIAKLIDLSKEIPNTKKILDDLKTGLESLKKDRAALKEPNILKSNDIPCPFCGEPLNISGGEIVKGGAITPEMQAKSLAEHETYISQINDFDKTIISIAETIAKTNIDLKIQTEASEQLAKPRNKTREIAEIDAKIS